MTVKQAYLAELAAKGYQSDPAQLRAVDALQRCADEWAQYKARRSNAIKKLINRPEIPRGVYMYGGVGRGKSFLMECFFDAVPLKRKVRLHFHEFMREVHRELAALQGTVNPLDVLGERIAKRYKLICFDEFHVADITDAMILHRLLVALFDNGVGFVTTSNFKPDDLYPGGLHRDRIRKDLHLPDQPVQKFGLLHFLGKMIDAIRENQRRICHQGEIPVFSCGAVAVHIDQPLGDFSANGSGGFHVFELCAELPGFNQRTDALCGIRPRYDLRIVGIPRTISGGHLDSAWVEPD